MEINRKASSMPPSFRRLSKSRVQSGAQCTLRLWNDCFERELATPADEVLQFIFDRGTQIGLVAQERYPGGQVIDAAYYETALALKQTEEALAGNGVPALFEPAFVHNNVLARIDVLKRAGRDEWDLIEVKGASTKKDVYLRDLAIQLWIVRGAGVRVRRAGLLLLNRDYVYDGKHLDLEQLFSFVDLTDEALAMHDEIEMLVSSLQQIVIQGNPPQVEPGEHCHIPYSCPYYAHCTRDYDFAQHPIRDLPRISAKKRKQLEEKGVMEIAKIPADFSLNEAQARVRKAVITGKDWASDGLAGALADISYPVHHLDFEAFMPAIPIFPGTRPFDAVPFQYSIHRQTETGDIEHLEYLHIDGHDPHRELAERLLADLGKRGSICVYSSYEKSTINSLAGRLPDLADELAALLDRIWDLLPIIQRHYYHPEFHGSFSIKSVLPVLVPELSYEDMEIGDGMAAASQFEIARGLDDEDARNEIYESLRVYCKQDTVAMVELRRALARRV
ncbi:MAG: DUF2779 domain-containing protein [Myxococcales bacterium]|nr:DUF2779 domain-containing protein [Myxococcales bacterium]